MKLTPIWMFIFLLAVLIISVLMGTKLSEGFTSKSEYVETDITGYANKVWPIVTSSIAFDKSNGNVVLQEGGTLTKIINRSGDETGSTSSVTKVDSPLATTVSTAWTSWTAAIGTNQVFYMPWEKTTFIHLIKEDSPSTKKKIHTSGFCFQGSNKTVGEYDKNGRGKTQTRGYASLDTVSNDRLETTASVAPKFLRPLYGIKSAGIFYDISSGCIVIPKTTDTFDVLDRDGNDVTMAGLQIVTEGSTKDKYDFSLGTSYKLLTGKLFEPWILNIATGTGADIKYKDVTDAIAAAATAKIAVETATVDVETATAAVAAATATTKATKEADLVTAKATLAAKTTALSTADGLVTEKKGALEEAVNKSILVMPYGVKTLIATFTKTSGLFTLVDVKRFDESGAIVIPSPPTTTPPPPGGSTPPGSTPPGSTPPSADSAISEYYKWYWYWNKTGKTASDDYMLKTQIVPPVCPACPTANCPVAAASTPGAVSGPGSAIAPISDAVKVTGSVAEKTVGTAGDVLKSFGSGATSIGLGTVDLAKGTVSGTADLAKGAASGTAGLARDVVGGTIGLARDVVGGTVGLAKDTVTGTVGLAKDTIGGTVDLARGKYSADEEQRVPRGSMSSSTSSYSRGSVSAMDPYTYNGQLQNKPSANYMPITANFSAFSR